MLSRINIRDLVIVRSLDLSLEGGMTALTGETGAGKSILIDALGLALGDKTDNRMIRAGATRAEVSVGFELPSSSPAVEWLAQHDLSSDGECLLRRVLVRDGRSRAYINGTPIPLATLRELGEQLIDIHGQHAHQSLMHAASQRQLLDEYAGLQTDVRALSRLHQKWRDAQEEHRALKQASADRASRLDYLHFQIEELEQLDCTAEGLHALESEQARLAHAERLLNETGTVLAELGENDPSLLQSLHRLTRTLSDLCALDPELVEAQEMLESAGIQIDEVISSLRHYRDQVDLDPERLKQVDEQLGRVHDAARKHRVSPTELGTLLAGLQAEAASLDDADQRLTHLAEIEIQRKQAYSAAARALSAARNKAAARLSATVSESMRHLGMQDGRFEVRCDSDPEHAAAHGLDRVAFMVSVNPGLPLAALAEVASGGELSRISLAIQVATVDCGQVPTLIFDEVDVGIGGAVAEIVGNLLRRLATRRQILCVTHLPQVASQAHQQLRVRKSSDGKTTETSIDPLDEAARVDEIARMLGGVEITRQTRQHALEMIQHAQNPPS